MKFGGGRIGGGCVHEGGFCWPGGPLLVLGRRVRIGVWPGR